MTPIPPTADDRRLLFRDLSLLLGIPLLLAIGLLAWWRPWVPAVYEAATEPALFDVLSGSWDWAAADSFCVANPHTISFADDRTVMYLTHRRPWTDSSGVDHRVSAYDLQEATRSRVRGLIRGETRRTDHGDPVVWDLILTSPNSYAWHRTDWPGEGRTAEVRRCPPGTEALIQPR